MYTGSASMRRPGAQRPSSALSQRSASRSSYSPSSYSPSQYSSAASPAYTRPSTARRYASPTRPSASTSSASALRPQRSVEDMFRLMDTDGDGVLNEQEFETGINVIRSNNSAVSRPRPSYTAPTRRSSKAADQDATRRLNLLLQEYGGGDRSKRAPPEAASAASEPQPRLDLVPDDQNYKCVNGSGPQPELTLQEPTSPLPSPGVEESPSPLPSPPPSPPPTPMPYQPTAQQHHHIRPVARTIMVHQRSSPSVEPKATPTGAQAVPAVPHSTASCSSPAAVVPPPATTTRRRTARNLGRTGSPTRRRSESMSMQPVSLAPFTSTRTIDDHRTLPMSSSPMVSQDVIADRTKERQMLSETLGLRSEADNRPSAYNQPVVDSWAAERQEASERRQSIASQPMIGSTMQQQLPESAGAPPAGWIASDPSMDRRGDSAMYPVSDAATAPAALTEEYDEDRHNGAQATSILADPDIADPDSLTSTEAEVLATRKRHQAEMDAMIATHEAEMIALREGTQSQLEEEMRLRITQEEQYEEQIQDLQAALQQARDELQQTQQGQRASLAGSGWMASVKLGKLDKEKTVEMDRRRDEAAEEAKQQKLMMRKLELQYAAERHKTRHLERMREMRQGCEVILLEPGKKKVVHMWMRLSDDEGRIDFGASALKARSMAMSTKADKNSILLCDVRRMRMGDSGRAFKERAMKFQEVYQLAQSVTVCMAEDCQRSFVFLSDSDAASWVLGLRTAISTDSESDLLEYGRFLWTRSLLRITLGAEEVKRKFRETDVAQFDALALRERFSSLGEALSDMEVDELVLEADTDGDGHLSLEEIDQRVTMYTQ